MFGRAPAILMIFKRLLTSNRIMVWRGSGPGVPETASCLAWHQVYPKVPTENSRKGVQPGHRQRRCMHVILIALLELKGRKIRVYSRQIIDFTIRIVGSVGVGMYKVGQFEVFLQSHSFGIRNVSAHQPAASYTSQVK